MLTSRTREPVQLSARTKDLCSGLVLFALGVGLWFYSTHSLGHGLSGPTEIGPEFFPQFIAAGLILLSPGLVIKSFVKRDAAYREPPRTTGGSTPQSPAAGPFVFIFTGLYVILAAAGIHSGHLAHDGAVDVASRSAQVVLLRGPSGLRPRHSVPVRNIHVYTAAIDVDV
jgi:hypothetical protein